MNDTSTNNLKKMERALFFKYKFHILTIFFIVCIFCLVIIRALNVTKLQEQETINYQTQMYVIDWKKVDESLRLEIKKIDQLSSNIKNEIEQQLLKENNLKKISINKIYEKFPELDNINIELTLLDPQGMAVEHQENPAYANKGSLERAVFDDFKLNPYKTNSYIFTKIDTKKIVFLQNFGLQNKNPVGILSIEINPKIIFSESDDITGSLFSNIYLFDSKDSLLFGETLHKNSIVDQRKFTDFSSLLNLKKDGDVLFYSNNSESLPISWAAFSSKEYFLSEWIPVKNFRIRNTILAVAAMILSVFLLIYFFRKFINTELINQLNTIKLKENISAKENIVTLLSHEIRTPINVILGLSQLSEDSSITKEDLIKNNDSIKSATKYLTKLLNEILSFNKLSATNFELDENFYNIEFVFNNLKILFKNRSKKDVAIIFNNGLSNDVLIKCDEFQIQQILINLIENSLKFTKQGSIEINAEEISRDNQNIVIRFSVSDTGIGIKKSEQAFIFDPFSQANSSIGRNFGGTGLGLAISKRIVERLGSKLEIHSEEGIGSSFYFDINFNYQIEPNPISTLSNPTSLSILNSTPAKVNFESLDMKGKVLLVDDHATTLEVMEKFLVKIGLDVTTATDGKSAIEHVITKGRFDIIIMDVQMPGLTGLETTKIIRLFEDENQIKRVPIISLSANTSDQNIESCILAGMDDFIEKPADFNKVHQVINTWVRN